MSSMLISLDTNIWIFGFSGANQFCQRIIFNLESMSVIVPNQVRAELERNLSDQMMKELYQLILSANAQIDYAAVPRDLIEEFEGKGLKKGDAQIGAFCQWRTVDILISDNRDFLKGLAPDHDFQVMSPEDFCKQFFT